MKTCKIKVIQPGTVLSVTYNNEVTAIRISEGIIFPGPLGEDFRNDRSCNYYTARVK
jgi:hypothetical protein